MKTVDIRTDISCDFKRHPSEDAKYFRVNEAEQEPKNDLQIPLGPAGGSQIF